MNIEELLLLSSLIKWSRSEPLSKGDLERLMGMIATANITIDTAEPDEIAGLQQRFQNVIRERFIPKQ